MTTAGIIDWDDPREYRWVFCHEYRSLAGILVEVVLTTFLGPLLFFLPLGLVNLVSTHVAAGIAVALLLYSVVVVSRIGYFLVASPSPEMRIKAGPILATHAMVGVGPLFFLLWQNLLLVEGFGTHSGLAWFGYLADNLAEVGLLNVPNRVFGLVLSDVVPVGWVGGSVQLLLKALMTVGIFGQVYASVKAYYSRSVPFVGTVQEMYWRCEQVVGKKDVVVELRGRFEPPEVPFAWNVRAVLDHYRVKAESEG